jgi:hypothetical protein
MCNTQILRYLYIIFDYIYMVKFDNIYYLLNKIIIHKKIFIKLELNREKTENLLENNINLILRSYLKT